MDARVESSQQYANENIKIMKRNNTIVLSDEERELVDEVKEAQYGEENIPHGFVIGNALRRVLSGRRDGDTSLEVATRN